MEKKSTKKTKHNRSKGDKPKSRLNFRKMFASLSRSGIHAGVTGRDSSAVMSLGGELRTSMRAMVRSAYGNQSVKLRLMHTSSIITTSAGGILNNVYSINLAGVNNVASVSALFDEYRFRSTLFICEPWYASTVTTTSGFGVCARAIDYDDNTAASSMDQLLDFDGSSYGNITKSWSLRTMPGAVMAPDDAWITTVTTSTVCWACKLYATGLPISTQIYTMVAYSEIEFRSVI